MPYLISGRAKIWLLPSDFILCISTWSEEEPEREGQAEMQVGESGPEVSSGHVTKR